MHKIQQKPFKKLYKDNDFLETLYKMPKYWFIKKIFHINLYYKHSKACCMSFSDGDVKFYYYDWKNRNNNLNLTYKQDLSLINDIVDKIKTLL